MNWEPTMPQMITLPIELYLPSGRVIRTPTNEYQKFRTYLISQFQIYKKVKVYYFIYFFFILLQITGSEPVQVYTYSCLKRICLPIPAYLLIELVGIEPTFWWLKVICIYHYTKVPFLLEIRLELITKTASMFCSTNWASRA